MRRLAPLLLALSLTAIARPAGAQYLTRPELAWRTLRTEHFVFHYPASMAAWTRDVAARAEGVHEAVRLLVGYAPARPVTVLVEDPSNVSNGFALPFLDAPAIFLWPTPPDPSSVLYDNRGWGEILAVHEFAHVAHLARPSRNPRQSLLWRLSPVELGPIARRAPRWLIEGYATYVEGRLTGSGRPASAGRAAILRQWALEGQLPTYAQLDGSRRFLGGSMAYLVGSAYLEWLAVRAGDESLTRLWRRMTARQDRGFVAAFTGVYGAPPDELYGRFTAELTGRALAVEDSLTAAGVAEGTLVQRLSLGTGAPALSPDGALVAVVVRQLERPSRLVVWRTADSAETPAARRARERAAALDPEDVPAVPGRPRPKRALHTLHPIGGRSHEQPRFLPDGQRILVVRSVPQGDGSERPDLFVWRFRDGDLRRVTRGASIREADPAPDGRRAAGVRCRDGTCDLVLVSLDDGGVRVLWPGAPGRTFFRPRFGRGDSVLVSVHETGRWRLALVAAAGGAPRFLPSDPANRFGGDFLPGGREVVTTSERGGVMHLERLDVETGEARPLTRTTGGHLAADVGADSAVVYFLALHARGYDLRRLRADSTPPLGPVALADGLFPAVPPAERAVADTFARAALPPDRPYGLGPRHHRVLPGVLASPEGVVGVAALAGTDPVGRLSWLLQGATGDRGAWRGGALSTELRTFAPRLRAELFGTRHEPTRQHDGAIAAATVGDALDVEYHGGAAGATLNRDHGAWSLAAAGGASLGRLTPTAAALDGERATRSLAHGRVSLGATRQRGRDFVSGRLTLVGAGGRTADSGWTRGIASAALSAGRFGRTLRASGAAGLTSATAPAFERFAVGGMLPPLFDPALLDQRWSVPTLPVATAAGRRLLAYRVETSLLGATPYYAAVGAGDRYRAAQRVVGVEWAFASPAIGFVALPAVRIVGGVGHSLDAPFRDRTRGYVSITYDP